MSEKNHKKEDCVFCRIAQKELPVKFLHDSPAVMAFADINPQAPTHLLIVPKQHYSNLNELKSNQLGLLQEMFEAARKLAGDAGIRDRGYRLALNVNLEGGQTVPHLHLHLLGGKQLGPSLVG